MFEMFGEKCTSDGFTDVSSQKNGEKWLAYFMVWNPHEYAVKVLSISNFFSVYVYCKRLKYVRKYLNENALNIQMLQVIKVKLVGQTLTSVDSLERLGV